MVAADRGVDHHDGVHPIAASVQIGGEFVGLLTEVVPVTTGPVRVLAGQDHAGFHCWRLQHVVELRVCRAGRAGRD